MKKKRLLIAVVLLIVGLVVIFGVAPSLREDKIRAEAPMFLEINGLKIVKEGEYDTWHDEVKYTVKKDTVTYNIAVRLVRNGALAIIPE